MLFSILLSKRIRNAQFSRDCAQRNINPSSYIESKRRAFIVLRHGIRIYIEWHATDRFLVFEANCTRIPSPTVREITLRSLLVAASVWMRRAWRWNQIVNYYFSSADVYILDIFSQRRYRRKFHWNDKLIHQRIVLLAIYRIPSFNIVKWGLNNPKFYDTRRSLGNGDSFLQSGFFDILSNCYIKRSTSDWINPLTTAHFVTHRSYHTAGIVSRCAPRTANFWVGMHNI